jgi:hypothetical protein
MIRNIHRPAADDVCFSIQCARREWLMLLFQILSRNKAGKAGGNNSRNPLNLSFAIHCPDWRCLTSGTILGSARMIRNIYPPLPMTSLFLSHDSAAPIAT